MIRLAAALALVSTTALAAPPTFVVEGLEPRGEVEAAASAAWRSLEALPPGLGHSGPPSTIRIRVARLAPNRSGDSTPGLVTLRSASGRFDTTVRTALRHELAHQFLFTACPASARDRLFHEAFSIATSGEAASWADDGYVSLPAALQQLAGAGSFDAPAARGAIARIVVETASNGGLPQAIARRLKRCASDAPWVPMTPAELAATGTTDGAAFVVISRHSGETLVSEGSVRTPMPFGSTLKPFLVAGARARGIAPPTLAPRASTEWSCGDALPARVDDATALLRSCNGWFLDWERTNAAIGRLGPYAPMLVRLGLEHPPEDVSEAIGLRTTLALTPLALAEAYRLLAASRPDVVTILRKNATSGTLAGLDDSPRFADIATKTGTVRDGNSAPRLGWIVAVSDDLVAVMVRPGNMPRQFAGELATRLGTLRRRAHRAVDVQVFGLLDASQLEVRCLGQGFRIDDHGIEPLPAGFGALTKLAGTGRIACSGGPFRVRFPGESGRDYAGTFRIDRAPPYRPAPGERLDDRQRRARRGSDVVFTTNLARYAAGVVRAEDDRITGAAREALLRVIAHDAFVARHDGRPLCDTTHCQSFLGTTAASDGDLRSLEKQVPGATGWLTFSQGGEEPWEESRPRVRVESILGPAATKLAFGERRARWIARTAEGHDEWRTVPCESLRGPLKLPSCPDRVREEADRFVFSGRGRGHGEGLDVEHAKSSRGTADELLRDAYGP